MTDDIISEHKGRPIEFTQSKQQGEIRPNKQSLVDLWDNNKKLTVISSESKKEIKKSRIEKIQKNNNLSKCTIFFFNILGKINLNNSRFLI